MPSPENLQPIAAEAPTHKRVEQKPVQEDEESVSYLGVRLEKAREGSQLVPNRENYGDYINDKFALELQQKIAVCLESGDPILVEGGTSIGKTTTVRKMAAELGWEVHYVNLTGATDVEDLMGRYIPNVHRVRIDDPEYAFADGKVTAGLRQEEGKTKIIILDELNAAPPNILIRLHEVLDALERGGDVILSEDASEAVPVSRKQTKVVALMNPPGKGYFGREPLDPAQLRRWVYQKEVSSLPKSTFEHSTAALFGLEKAEEELPPQTYLSNQEQTLSPDQLKEIPGIAEILVKYQEFHQAALGMLKNRRLAQDQPQPFLYDDRMEPRRVRDFVQRFYNGDVNETFQKALQYYYGGKLETDEDRQKLNELISHVSYSPPAESRRRGLDPVAATESATAVRPETIPSPLEGPIGEQMRLAQEILGEPNVLGIEAVEKAFARRLTESEVPPIPFSRAELENAKRLGQFLVLRIDKASDGQPLSMKKIREVIERKMEAAGKGKLLYEPGRYDNEDFFTKETPTLSWALTSKELVTDSTSKSYLQQAEVLIDYLKKEVFKGTPLPPLYQEAIEEFKRQKSEISGLIDSDWQQASQRLADLKITHLTRSDAVETVYDLALTFDANSKRLLENNYSWTKTLSSGGRLVCVGDFDADGARVDYARPGYFHDKAGVSFSRSL